MNKICLLLEERWMFLSICSSVLHHEAQSQWARAEPRIFSIGIKCLIRAELEPLQVFLIKTMRGILTVTRTNLNFHSKEQSNQTTVALVAGREQRFIFITCRCQQHWAAGRSWLCRCWQGLCACSVLLAQLLRRARWQAKDHSHTLYLGI